VQLYAREIRFRGLAQMSEGYVQADHHRYGLRRRRLWLRGDDVYTNEIISSYPDIV
jgi:hypothetical protein